MHRSGTSLVTGLLNCCGLYLGDRLLGKAPSNAKGHFEDRMFIALNDWLMKINGGTWDRPPKKVEFVHRVLFQRMRDFVNRWPKKKIVGWKDPRACLTLPIWRQVIEPEALRVVLVTRPADEIAASLHARNGMDLERGRQLAFLYVHRAKQALNGMEWKATAYHDYFKQPYEELLALANFLGLRVPSNGTQVNNFIDEKLWHHRSGT